jgi:hypothetical protein
MLYIKKNIEDNVTPNNNSEMFRIVFWDDSSLMMEAVGTSET